MFMFKNASIKSWLITFFLSINLAILLRTYLTGVVVVSGYSMFPTLTDGDKVVTLSVSIIHVDYERGDIVLLKAPSDDGKIYVKRIIGIAGDEIEIKEGKVILNGEILEEDYISQDYTGTYEKSSWIVPFGEVFVMGDNREPMASNDSRIFGCIPLDSLMGKANLRIYPFHSFGKIQD